MVNSREVDERVSKISRYVIDRGIDIFVFTVFNGEKSRLYRCIEKTDSNASLTITEGNRYEFEGEAVNNPRAFDRYLESFQTLDLLCERDEKARKLHLEAIGRMKNGGRK